MTTTPEATSGSARGEVLGGGAASGRAASSGPPGGGSTGGMVVSRHEHHASTLVTPRGRTSIADGVVRKIAGVATREVAGVHNLGSGGARAFGALRERIPGSGGPNIAQGVSVEVGERQAAIDLDVVVEYGVAIVDLSQAIRRNVINAVETMTGLEVTEVNISVDDIYIASDDEPADQPAPRVQ